MLRMAHCQLKKEKEKKKGKNWVKTKTDRKRDHKIVTFQKC